MVHNPTQNVFFSFFFSFLIHEIPFLRHCCDTFIPSLSLSLSSSRLSSSRHSPSPQSPFLTLIHEASPHMNPIPQNLFTTHQTQSTVRQQTTDFIFNRLMNKHRLITEIPFIHYSLPRGNMLRFMRTHIQYSICLDSTEGRTIFQQGPCRTFDVLY